MLASLVSFGNVDYKRQPMHSICSTRMLFFLQLAVATDLYFSYVVLIFSLSKNAPQKSWTHTMLRCSSAFHTVSTPLHTSRNALSWLRFHYEFNTLSWNIHINGQKLNYDLMKEFIKVPGLIGSI